MAELPLPELPVGQIFGLDFSPDGKRLGMTLISSQSPGDAYSIDLASGGLTRWTFSEAGGLDTSRFASPEVVEFPTFDQVGGESRMIPAFYYRPPGEGPFPVVVNIHGGPEGQARPFFNPITQYYVLEMGIAVLFPNVRGSSGYGKSYLLLDNAEKREDSVRDIGALLDWIETRPELDSDRIAVVGGSYGGYMVLASMVHFDDRLRAGIDLVGISNFVTFLENTSDYRRDLRRVEYGDERDPEMRAFLESISPTNHAAKINKPLFVVQGLNDPRVPASESEQMVDVIRDHGGTVWYLMAKDEGHGFDKKANRDYFSHAAVLFLEQYLIGGGGGDAPAGPAAE
jgi:dipeptidyl aminopeptidase/acylaminoacyl peptidase